MILDMLRHTPFWVWAVLMKLVVLGLWQSRARRIGRGRVTLLPLVMIGLSFGGVLSSFGVRWRADQRDPFHPDLTRIKGHKRHRGQKRQREQSGVKLFATETRKGCDQDGSGWRGSRSEVLQTRNCR